jgi:ribonuclease P protein component
LQFWRSLKLQRLKTRSQFQAVLSGGTVARTAHFALHCAALDVSMIKQTMPEPSKAPPVALFVVRDVWMGAMVPKRWAKRAVTRNTIKRQIYSVSNDFESVLPVAAHVVRLRAGFDRKQFISATSDELKASVRLELQQLFTRAATRSPTPAHQVSTP